MAYKRFIGANNSAWGTASNWDNAGEPARVPNSGDEAVFDQTSNFTVTNNASRFMLHFVVVNNITLTITNSASTYRFEIGGNLTNNGTIICSSTLDIRLVTTGGQNSYIYNQNYIQNVLFRIDKIGYFAQFDSNFVLQDTASSPYGSTTENAVLRIDSGTVKLQSRTFTVNRLTINAFAATNVEFNGTVIVKHRSTGPMVSIGSSAPTYLTLSNRTGEIILDPYSLGSTINHALSGMDYFSTYDRALKWTINGGTSRTFSGSLVHMKNPVINCSLSTSTTIQAHDGISGTFGPPTGTVSATINAYANNGVTYNYNVSIVNTTTNFYSNTGTNNVFNIQDLRATTSNLNSSNTTYYLNISGGTAAKTFNLSSSSNSTYYVRVLNSGTVATINANGINCTYYYGWSGNSFTQNTGAFTINCNRNNVGTGCVHNFNDITDNASTPCSINLGGGTGTPANINTFNFSSGVNIVGTVTFEIGTFALTGTPVVGTFTSTSLYPKTFNWNGNYLRINNQARTANAHGTGSVRIGIDSTSDMTSSDTSNGGIQMESTGNIEAGNWYNNPSMAPRVKLVAFGTTASNRVFATSNSYIRSLDIEGPCVPSVSGSGIIIGFVGATNRITWNGVGSAANFNSLNAILANTENSSFTYDNSAALTDSTKRINAVVANNSYGTLPNPGNTIHNITAYCRDVSLTKGSCIFNLNNINVSGYVQCKPATSSGVTYNWKNVVKSVNTVGWSGYNSVALDSFVAEADPDGRYTTHNFTDSGINSANTLVIGSFTSPPTYQCQNINFNASLICPNIYIYQNMRVYVNNNITVRNILLNGSAGGIFANSNFTVTGRIQQITNGSDFSAGTYTITFTGEYVDSVDYTVLLFNGGGQTGIISLNNSTIVVTNSSASGLNGGQDRELSLGNGLSYGTIINNCTFTHTGSGDGTGWLRLQTSVSGTANSINTLQSQDNSVPRGFRPYPFTAPIITNPNISGTSANRVYIYGNLTKGGGGDVNLQYLGIRNSTVSGANGNWVADDSIDYGSNSGWTINTTATYSITPAANSVDEGNNLTVNISTTGISNGTTLYWTISHIDTNDSDFSAVSGSFTINSNAGSFTITALADDTTEGSQTFNIQIRRISITGTIVATSSAITINDTSLTKTYSISPAANNVDEGVGLTVNISTSGVNDGTTLYWTISHVTSNASDFSATSGSFTINSNSGSFSITPRADYILEGTETFAIQIRTGSISGSIVATSSNVTINDTSTYPVFIGFFQFF